MIADELKQIITEEVHRLRLTARFLRKSVQDDAANAPHFEATALKFEAAAASLEAP